MKFFFLRYLLAFILPAVFAVGMICGGYWTFLPLIYAFGLVPVFDHWFGKSSHNHSSEETEKIKTERIFSWLLYLAVPVLWVETFWMLWHVANHNMPWIDFIGNTIGMGLLCGVIGINVAHELGHRNGNLNKVFCHLLLLRSLYLHFYIEHNKGHHRNVATPNDAATAFYNESVYKFWFRVIFSSVHSAWQIETRERKRKGLNEYSFGNRIIQYFILEIVSVLLVFFFFGTKALCIFVLSASIGILLLETVNYIEHYGLRRNKINEFRYEDVQVWHSWNSDYYFGRWVLFELTRHSDHHLEPSREYQVLRSHPHSLELPSGYPAMMLLALIPPLWYKVVNPLIDKE